MPDGLVEGDYPKALTIQEKHLQSEISNNHMNAVYHSVVLYLMGDYERAYKSYLELIRELQNGTALLLSVHLSGVGGLLYRMRQLDRAMTVYQAAVAILPESPFAYLGLVNFYNDQRKYPERALELSHEMMKYLPNNLNRLNIPILYFPLISEAQFYSTHAIALANMGQFDEAESYIQKMYDYADESFIPYYAARFTG